MCVRTGLLNAPSAPIRSSYKGRQPPQVSHRARSVPHVALQQQLLLREDGRTRVGSGAPGAPAGSSLPPPLPNRGRIAETTDCL
jgi:hypothetical protein